MTAYTCSSPRCGFKAFSLARVELGTCLGRCGERYMRRGDGFFVLQCASVDNKFGFTSPKYARMGDYWDAFPPGPSPQLWWSWGSGWDAIMRGWHAMRSAYVVFDVLRLLIVGGCCKPRRPRTRDPYRLMASGPSPQLMWSWGNGWDEVVIVIYG